MPRRIAVRAQLLDADRPADLMAVVDHLTLLQLDPTAAVAPSADLVTWSRVGSAYDPADLRRALSVDKTLFEHVAQEAPTEPAVAMVRPMADIGLYLADMLARRADDSPRRQWVRANEGFRRRLLDLLATSGPLQSRDIPDSAEVSWASSGWTNDRNVTQMLQFLTASGEVAIAGRRGRQRLWDLAERVYPPDSVVVAVEEAHAIRAEKRLRALGVARPHVVGEAGVPAEVDGTPGVWRLDPSASAAGFRGRTALLSPFDRLVHDRVRASELFGFDYVLEMYKPKEQRRWGYFALPVLHHDGLVGKIDALNDRKARRLVVNAVHEDVPFAKRTSAAVQSELDDLGRWLGCEVVRRHLSVRNA